MARTPLLRAFERLADEHRAAEHLGIPPAELRGEAAALSRREFLKRAGIAGAGLAVGPGILAARSAQGATAPRIAIVGGGIAGLTAALTLADKGFASTVYEASTRIGGRMHSDTLRLLRQRPGLRVLRRADRHRSHDDPPSRAALRPRDRRPARGASRTAPTTRTGSSAATTRRIRPTRTSSRSTTTLQTPGHGHGLSDDVPARTPTPGSCFDQMIDLRLDRALRRPAGTASPIGPAARRRLQHRVRRRDEGPGRAQPRLPARLPGSTGQLPHLRQVGRALPHRRRQRAAAAGDRASYVGRAERQARLGDAVDPGERRRHGRR